MDAAHRRTWVTPRVSGVMRGIDLALLDPDNPDQRRLMIEGEHPELWDALARHEDEIVLHGETMSPGLHISMHEIVTNQIWDDDPPEVWQTAQRLTRAGYDRHEVLHMIGSAVSAEVWYTLHEHQPFDLQRYQTALHDLPGSWEAMRQPDRPHRAERRHRYQRR